MSARSDVLSLPRSKGKAGNKVAWAVLAALVAGAVAAGIYASTRSAPVASKPLKDQAVTKVTGTGPGLAVIGQDWALHGQVPAITGTGPGLTVAAQEGAVKAATPVITGTGPDLAYVAGSNSAATEGASKDEGPTPAKAHAKQLG
jgi:hypothetical protein